MKKILLAALLLFTLITFSQQTPVDKIKVREDLNLILTYIPHYYVYLPERDVDINCLKEYYTSKIDELETEDDAVLMFEYLLDEFHDSHVMLNTNRNDSYRLYSPLYTSLKNGKAIITSVWLGGIEPIKENIIGAEVVKINDIELNNAIASFPTHCNDKADAATREWIINKIIAARYSQPRQLTLKLRNKKTITFDLDKVKQREYKDLLTAENKNSIGIITINNSLGNNDLVSAFDTALDKLIDTKSLIIDLRNTVDGGNTYVARGIMSRFTDVLKPYQKHSFKEQYGNNPAVERSWLEYVSPRGRQYNKPVVVLVSRWTGSMGEGLAIGMESVAGATVIGTEMERLAGEMNGFPFKNRNYSFRLSTAKLFHVNGISREKYLPERYVQPTTNTTDETMEKGIEVIREIIK